MSITLYNQTVHVCNALITKRYSTSFTWGIRLLGKKYQQAIYGIYGYVRLADEIVDSFHGHDRKTLLEEFERDTWLAMERGISINPVIHSFYQVVQQYAIDPALVQSFLNSMRMDLDDRKYDPALYSAYIYGSAEVVGLMCLKVFCEGDKTQFDGLTPAAKSLGAALQKVNFLRDMKDDFYERGRVYFPGLDIHQFDADSKRRIEEDIQKDFNQALEGIRQLPEGCRIGVYLAYRYYIKLFNRIKKRMPQELMEQRLRINNVSKVYIMARSFARYKLNLL